MRARLFAVSAVIAVFAVLCASALAGCGKTSAPATGTSLDSGATNTSGTVPATTSSGSQSDHQNQPKSEPSGQETSDVEAASNAAVSSAKAENPALGELQVLEVKVSGEWARVDIRPADGSTDKASWLLRKVNGSWQVVDRGTPILPTDHPDAPSEVFSWCSVPQVA